MPLPVPLHPAVVHLPLGLAFAIPLVAIGIAIAHRRSRLPRAALVVLVGLQALLVGSGFVAMQLGEREEDAVEKVVAKTVIHEHEDRAEVFVWAAAAVLVGAAATLVVPSGAVGAVAGVVAAGTIAVAALGALTGHAGGQIVYAHGGAAAFASREGQTSAVTRETRARARASGARRRLRRPGRCWSGMKRCVGAFPLERRREGPVLLADPSPPPYPRSILRFSTLARPLLTPRLPS